MTITIDQLERDLEDTREDLRRAKLDLERTERAPYEGRMTDRAGWEQTLSFRRKKVYRLQGEERLLMALLEGAELASDSPASEPGNLTNGEGSSDA